MAGKDGGGGQERAAKGSSEVDEVVEQTETDVAERKAEIDEDVDAILDEIDEVLESNAEAFVSAFVQKGGQ